MSSNPPIACVNYSLCLYCSVKEVEAIAGDVSPRAMFIVFRYMFVPRALCVEVKGVTGPEWV